MKFPTIKEVSEELCLVNCNVEGERDIRLQVYEDGKWIIRTGSSDYDQDCLGYFGASSVPGVVQELNTREIGRASCRERV